MRELSEVDDRPRSSSGGGDGARHWLVVALTVNTGVLDAVGFILLGNVFSSVMTGNMILFGLGVAGNLDMLAHSALAIAAFIVGLVVGARIAKQPLGNDPVWPPSVTAALTTEAVIVVVAAVGLAICGLRGAEPHGAVQLTLLTLNTVSLGIQSSAVQRFGVAGLSSTYLTGTLTAAMGNLAHRDVRGAVPKLQILFALVVGATIGAVLAFYAPAICWLPEIMIVPAVVCVARAAFGRGRPDAAVTVSPPVDAGVAE